jgi:hypothetical protein
LIDKFLAEVVQGIMILNVLKMEVLNGALRLLKACDVKIHEHMAVELT